MNESTGNAMLFYIVIVFVIIITSIFLASMAYTKAYKVKNKVIEEIEKQGEHSSNPEQAYTLAQEDIETWMSEIGYLTNTAVSQSTSEFCTSDRDNLQNRTGSAYRYCVWMYETKYETYTEVYYKVTTYMYLDLPIIGEFAGNLIAVPVTGETMTFKTIEDH